MKSKLVLFIILGIVFLRCSYQEKELEYRIADTSKTISDTLYFKSKQISRVKLSIIGKIEGDAIIELENGAGRIEKNSYKRSY